MLGETDAAKAKQLYDRGESLAAIALAVGVSRAEIAWYERNRWRGRARAPAPIAPRDTTAATRSA